MSQGRLAEAYTNREYYECQLREMEKLRQNLMIYDKLLENQVSGLTKGGRVQERKGKLDESEAHDESQEDNPSSDGSFDQLKSEIMRKIADYIQSNLR